MITTIGYRDEKDIIASSKLVHSPGMKPHRIVLRKLEPGKWVTHLETMAIEVQGGSACWVHDSYNHGNYFGGFGGDEGTSFAAAMDDFKARAVKL